MITPFFQSRQNQIPLFRVTHEKFPLINYGYFVLKKGGNSGAVLNASNEVLVNAFLNHEIKYLDINKIIDKIMSTYAFIKNPSVEDLVKTDKEVRKLTKDLIGIHCFHLFYFLLL